MKIIFDEQNRVFKLDTPNSSYMIKIADTDGFILHMYYGRRLSDIKTDDLCRLEQHPFVPSKNERERASFMDCAPFEYPCHGLGDYRDDAFSVLNPDGYTATSLSYKSYRIYNGKPGITGLPATFGSEDECETLEITGEDSTNGLEITLLYSVFKDTDAIARSVRIKNLGKYGKHYVSSLRGESSHQEHPFLGLLAKNADEDNGEVYGFNFVYSGNFIAQAEKSQFDSIRVLMGINPVDFAWNLKTGEVFETPEIISVYSHEGIGGMTRSFHDLYRKHLIRSSYRDKKRPILINNWEATYFDFNTEKLVSIAKKASELGIEMLVMDDGWFGHRNDDSSSLGDWYVNEEKLPGGLKPLADEVNKLGMKFGIWMEPEMISPDSDLFRTHPDWAIQIPGRTPVKSRAQLVLDLSRKEVVDYVYERVSSVLKSANIEYLKWDMNRQLTDLGSSGLAPEAQGELFHRYCLGVYDLQERLLKDFPGLLLENCSGGGARFDPGMLYYSPQIWTSDDQDPVERLKIQQGTALIYPLSTMGAHVCDCPNHTTGRTTPFETRGYVALSGTFGYELDVTRIPEEDQALIPYQIKMYHRFNDLVRTGDYYRIASFLENNEWDAWEVVSPDKSEALVTVINVRARVNMKARPVKLKGLDPEKLYTVTFVDIKAEPGKEETLTLSGDALMYAGINPRIAGMGDYRGRLIHVKSE